MTSLEISRNCVTKAQLSRPVSSKSLIEIEGRWNEGLFSLAPCGLALNSYAQQNLSFELLLSVAM